MTIKEKIAKYNKQAEQRVQAVKPGQTKEKNGRENNKIQQQ